MNLRRVRRQRGLGVQNGGKGLILHIDQSQRVQGRGLVHRRDGRHFVAHEQGAVDRQRRLIVDDRSPQNGRDVPAGQDRLDPRKAEGAGHIEMNDARMRIGTPEHLGVKHPRKRHVRHVFERPRDLVGRIDHRRRFSDH